MENEQEQLKKLAQIFNTGNVITADQVKQVLTGIVAIMGAYKGDTQKLNSDTKQGIVRMVNALKKDHADVLAECESKNKKLKETVDKAVEAVEKKLLTEADVKKISDKIISDKIAKDHESLVSDVLSKITIPEFKETVLDGPVQLANKLELLQGDERLKASALAGLEEAIDARINANFPNGRGGGAFRNTIGGGVTQIKAGTGVTIDSTGAGGRGVVTITATGSGITDGDKGDITVSGSGATWTIDNEAVTLAKMANMATASLLGRNTAGTGVPEVLSAATAKSLLSLNNVENTALSTWAGTTNITTLGTITTGVWSGTAISLAKGGTGAALVDPGADTLMGWDDTDGSVVFFTIGSNLAYDHATHTLSATGGAGTPTAITVADESADTTCFPLFVTAATGDLGPKTNAGLAFNSATGVLTATGFSGPLTGNVTGNVSGTAATVTGAAQTAITSLGTLTVLQVDNLNINGNTISATTGAVNITPEAGSAILLDGTISIDAGVVTGATSISSTTFVGALTGNASTATALATPRTIGGVSFDGTANITVATATGGFTVSGGALALGANDLTMTGSLGTTGARLTKGWFTDLQVTNAIAGSITGNAATVTNATLTTALTVDTGTVRLVGNVANTSVLTIGAGAVSVSGTNTGDQTSVSGNAGTATALQNARTIGGVSFDGTANITVATATGGFTVSGGNLALGTNSLTLTGSIAATGSRVTKVWTADIESTNMPTVGGTSLTTVAQTFQNKTMTNSNNVLGGVTMTLGSDADGDIYYRSGGVLTRLAKGTASQILQMNAGATAPEWATPSSGGDVYALTAKPTTYYTYQIPMFTRADSSSDDNFSGWTLSGYTTGSEGNGMYATLITTGGSSFMYSYDNSAAAIPGTGSTLAHTFASSKKTVLSLRFKGDSTGNWFVGLGTNTNANWYTASTSSSGGHRAGFGFDGTNFRSITDNGSSVTANTISTTVTNWMTLRIEFDPGSACRFYLNGALQFTHSTNLPSTGNMFIGSGHSASGKTYYMSAPTISVEL